MAHFALSLVIAAAVAGSHTNTVDLNAQSKDPISLAKSANLIIIADDDTIKGKDPHGNDPHDENHDKDLPAEDHRDDYKPKEDWKAPKDPYGGEFPKGRAPY